MQFQEDPPPQGLSEARRGSAVFCKYTCRHRSAAGAPRRGRRGSSQINKRYKHSTTHICLILFSWETQGFEQMVKYPLLEGTVPVPPQTAPALCDGAALPSRELSLEGMPQRWGRRHHVPQPKKSVEKNSMRISHENGHDAGSHKHTE